MYIHLVAMHSAHCIATKHIENYLICFIAWLIHSSWGILEEKIKTRCGRWALNTKMVLWRGSSEKYALYGSSLPSTGWQDNLLHPLFPVLPHLLQAGLYSTHLLRLWQSSIFPYPNGLSLVQRSITPTTGLTTFCSSLIASSAVIFSLHSTTNHPVEETIACLFSTPLSTLPDPELRRHLLAERGSVVRWQEQQSVVSL